MFIHFGLYSAAARHEWVKNREELTTAEYQRYFDHFDPDLADPADWAAQAKAAGMRYVVLTTKHHDGFCLWDASNTDYKITNTPYGKDLVRAYAEAAREAGLRVGFYHSLIDWHHPDFTVDGYHPQRGDSAAREANAGRDFGRYVDYLHAQVRELLTDYGRIDYLFYDFSYPGHPEGGKGRADWRSEELLALTRQLQPGIVVNDRLDIPADIVTPEQYQPVSPMLRDGEEVPWEACQTTNGSWGYDRDNHDHKSPDLIVRMLANSVSNGGNMLLNVGPNGRGEFDPTDRHILREVGDWMRLHERAIIGAGPSAYVAPADCHYTQAGNRLYVHVFAWPMGHLHLPDLAGKVSYAQLLHDGSEINRVVHEAGTEGLTTQPGGQPAGTLTLELPMRAPSVALPVIELFLTDQRNEVQP
ncbi:alpha-L-fucosidase [Flexivirga meconopsidis]|uniref:alpha-L-fucosidase n=1 Tax=Flexivirga meconopsidis TaxID=2977121 RepID=UPI003CC55177